MSRSGTETGFLKGRMVDVLLLVTLGVLALVAVSLTVDVCAHARRPVLLAEDGGSACPPCQASRAMDASGGGSP